MKRSWLGHAVGYVAVLTIAVAGTAQALPGKNTVDSGDIKNGQVKRADIANNAVTGAKVVESTLATVPNAGAVDGMSSTRFVKSLPPAQATPVKVASLGGLEVRVGCQQDGVDPGVYSTWVQAVSGVSGAVVIHAVSAGADSESGLQTVSEGVPVDVTVDSTPAGVVTLVYSTPAGGVVQAEIGFNQENGAICFAQGVLFGG